MDRPEGFQRFTDLQYRSSWCVFLHSPTYCEGYPDIGIGCQDIDDALHARVLPNGNYEVGVHIADVTHFVKPNNPMDDEATARGTTVYLVDKRIDMLPMLLGTDLCSLIPYVDRFAFSVIWELTPDAQIVNVNFTKSAIRSREAFSYEQAQIRIDDR